ncbi:MAG: hypothetical protein Q9218_006946, partial [Villophora microphyllina]
MHLCLISLALTLVFCFSSTQAGSSTALSERVAGSEGTLSRIKRRCPLPGEEPPQNCRTACCRPPVEDPPEDPPDPSVHSYTINDPEVYKKPIAISITVPSTLSVQTWNDVLLANLQTTLPSTLKQFNVATDQISALTKEGLPLLLDAITAVQSGLSLPDDNANLVRRGFFSKIGKFIKKVINAIVKTVEEIVQDIECSIFAALTLPGFMFSNAAFAFLNSNLVWWSTTSDQDYFISPLHGSVSHDDNIQIYYGAAFGPGFGSAAAVTFGRKIYVRADDRSARTADTPLRQDYAFQALTKTLLHEFTHVKQYKAVGYLDNVFGARYLFDFCK